MLPIPAERDLTSRRHLHVRDTCPQCVRRRGSKNTTKNSATSWGSGASHRGALRFTDLRKRHRAPPDAPRCKPLRVTTRQIWLMIKDDLQTSPRTADTLGVAHGWPESSGPDLRGRVFHPRMGTAKVSAIACAALLVVAIASESRGALVFAAIPFMFFVQCFQHVEMAGNRVRRSGLRAVDLDLSSARVTKTGRSWWVQLFFLGHCLEVRDADGHGLLLEAWLWSAETRQALVQAVAAANPSDDPSGESAHS